MSAEVFSRDASIWAPFSVPWPSSPSDSFSSLSFLPPPPSSRTPATGIMQCSVSFHSTYHFSPCTGKAAPRREETEKKDRERERETRMNPAT